jgi:hypothetical protein
MRLDASEGIELCAITIFPLCAFCLGQLFHAGSEPQGTTFSDRAWILISRGKEVY